MTEVIYLAPGEQMPEMGYEKSWVIVEASDDGRFFGTGAAFKLSGESVIYASLAANDGGLHTAIEAARRWAEEYKVPRIWVQPDPADL